MPEWRAALCWFALVPLLVALALPGKDGNPLGLGNAATLGYLCGFLWYLGSCFWIYQTMYLYGGLPKPVSFGITILFSLYLGLYHALFAVLFTLVRRARVGTAAAIGCAPFLWVAVELARGRLTGFPWNLLGNVLVGNLFVTRLAPVAGVLGISFLVAAANSGLAWFAFGVHRSKWLVPGAALAVIAGLQAARSSGAATISPALQTAVLMQENLSVGATGREAPVLSVQDELTKFTAASQAPRRIEGFSGTIFFGDRGESLPHPELIVWPEAPSHFQSNDPAFQATMSALAKTSGAPLIVGSLGVDNATESTRGYSLYDSASLFSATGSYSGRYDKIHLVPWGEYVPFKAIFSFAEKLTEGVGNMDQGQSRTVFNTGGHTYGIFICYESIFGNEVREFAKNGAEVLVNISDDGWYGESGAPWQHLNMVRMRAVENHRWILRSTNTGVTTAIDPLGRVALEAPRHVRAAFAFPFGYQQDTTFYTRHGDWFAYLCSLVTVLAVLFAWPRKHLLK